MRNWATILNILILTVVLTTKASDTNITTNTIQYFSADFSEARQKFVNAAQDAGAVVEHFQNPHTGAHGQILYTDVALLGPEKSETILVLSSGTHGVEGFTGSAIQTCLLNELSKELPPNFGLLFIHGINPYGFAYLRRFNEDNIDINRNFIDHSSPPPSNQNYDKLSQAINPQSISLWADFLSIIKFISFYIMEGGDALKSAVSQGQYNHPQGLFYGGRKDSWSRRMLEAVAEKYLRSAKRVIIIDFHTGLGPFGNAEIIIDVDKDSDAYRRALKWFLDVDILRIPGIGDSVSVPLTGSLKKAWPVMLPDSEVTAVSLEFGTLPRLQVLWALRKENWLHFYGGKDHPNAAEIKENLLKAFYPEEYEWRIKVLEYSKWVVSRVWKQLPK